MVSVLCHMFAKQSYKYPERESFSLQLLRQLILSNMMLLLFGILIRSHETNSTTHIING